MKHRYINLAIILIIVAIGLWAALTTTPLELGSMKRSMNLVLGLDLRGGIQVLLEADLPADATITAGDLDVAKTILENRSNALGVSEVVFQTAGDRRIVGEFPGATNADEVIATLKTTGILEFVDFGDTYMEPDTIVKTDFNSQGPLPSTDTTLPGTADKIYHTVMTGDKLTNITVQTDQLGKFVIGFVLKDDGPTIFGNYTTNNVGKYLGIVLDKKVLSCPAIQDPITTEGIITGNFTYETANALAVQLRYGSLPIPLKVIESRVIGASLGEDSLTKSMLAGIVGIIIVVLFMTIYYRLPGLLAIFAIIIYGLITIFLYKLIPVTLTLPGIAGLLLSTGGALDANILLFERMKEELRAGRNLKQSLDIGWKRAWSSIRDSNIATLITSAILFWFGSQFGASIVKGFAITLALGVVISLFAAIFVTRTLLSVSADIVTDESTQHKLYGA
jgi:preprotein translocase subunit SecD